MLDFQIDPFITCLAVGAVWPLLQEAGQRNSWSPGVKRWIAVGFALIVSVGVWFAGAYPASWELFTSQFLVVFGAGQAVFMLLKRVGVFSWLGLSDQSVKAVEDAASYVGKHRGTVGK